VDQFKRLVASVREFPQMLDIRPLVVDADMVVLGGNMRLKACREAGLTAVPVVIADALTPDQRREFVIKDNASFGAWDWDALANEWSDLPLADWGIDVPWDVQAGTMPDIGTPAEKLLEAMTFVVTNEQADVIREAIAAAKALGPFVDTGNENGNGNGLARVAELALGAVR
jgi:hypothetical protein